MTQTQIVRLVAAAVLLWSVSIGADSRIAFTSRTDGNAEIFLVSPDGSDLTRLTDHVGQDVQPAWSDDGTRIAFVSDRGGNNDIWRMSADGSMLQRLTVSDGDISFSHPAWSPGGHRIVFQSEPSGTNLRSILWVIGSDGLGLQSLHFLSNYFDLIHPAWSPQNGLVAVYIVPVDHRRVGLPAGLLFYGFSDVIGRGDMPMDLRNIEFFEERMAYDADGDIWVSGLYGQDPVNITRTPGIDEANPSWSPDGTALAYEADGWILTTALDGGEVRAVVEGTDPAWSPELRATAVNRSSWGQAKSGPESTYRGRR